MNVTATPGYNTRIAIYFTTSRKGQKLAFRLGRSSARAFRMSLTEAESLIAQGMADQLDSHPFKA